MKNLVPEMKKFAAISFAIAATICVCGCLYSPEKVYTYWKFYPEDETFSPLRTEFPLSDAEKSELGVVETLPENAKISEPK